MSKPGPKPAPLAERFAQYVNTNGPIPAHCPELGPCHEWTGMRDHKGYGRFGFGGFSKGTKLAHRVSFLIAEGRWPTPCGLHRCDNPGCVRREHIFEGTKQDNTDDMVSKGRAVSPNRGKTVCVNGHEFTPENTVLKPNGHRRCLACKRADWHRWAARKEANRAQA